MRRIIAISFSVIPLAAAAFGGALWIADASAPAGNSASVEMMQVLRDEHALVADYVKMDTQAKRLANATADQEAATLKVAALEQSRMRMAQAERAAQVEAAAGPERKVATARVAVRSEPAVAPIGEPLPLVQMASANVAMPPRAEGPVRSRLRSFVADVRRVPGWFASAADWMAEGVPVPRLLHVPGRQFRAEL